MVFTIDFLDDGAPIAWSLTDSGTPDWAAERQPDYRPALYAVSRHGMETTDPDDETCHATLADLESALDAHPAVVATATECWRPGFRFAEQPVLRVELDRVSAIRPLARYIERQGPPGQVPFRTFDVDFTPEFRYCLDRGVSPRPAREPRALQIALSREAVANEDLTALKLGTESGATAALEPAGETATAALETLRNRLAVIDPDVLVVDRATSISLLADAAVERGIDLGLQRVPAGSSRAAIPAYQQLAGASTFESYGQRQHSPARYNVPGRAILDRSNTFFFRETNLAGCLDLVERSHKPLQELAWASIGNVLTAIQIREARERNVLVQWHAWRPERFKTASRLHAGDRGGTTLSPVVGLHENVHELDFASLYPNVIRTRNLSPETVRCRCHDGADVPELGYSVCDDDGYLPTVLGPLIDDRAEMKATLRAADAGEIDLSDAECARLKGQSSALKWILVSCFGYQGFSNAKFGRIEVHEAINAYARDVLLTAKESLEAGGWRVLHGIVDSLWVTPRPRATDRVALTDLAATITAEVGIDLEYEGAFDWVAFCPRRNGEAGALTRYFGRHADGTGYKVRGIECRQRSTCAWVGTVQRDLLDVLDATRSPDAVCDRLRVHLRALCRGAVDARDLVITTRASKEREAYTQHNRTVAALDRAAERGLDTHAGQDVRYVVSDDSEDSLDGVRLATEVDATTEYDASFYRTQAARAAASVLSPLGWDTERVQRYLDGLEVPRLAAFED